MPTTPEPKTKESGISRISKAISSMRIENPLHDSKEQELVIGGKKKAGPWVPLILILITAGIIYVTIKNYSSTGRHVSAEVLSVAVYQLPGDPQNAVSYLLPIVDVRNTLGVAIQIQSMTMDVVTNDGNVLHATAAQDSEFTSTLRNYPDLYALQRDSGDVRLQRNVSIDPTYSSHGSLLFRFPLSQDAWQNRRSATITILVKGEQSVVLNVPSVL